MRVRTSAKSMHLHHAYPAARKGWLAGPWNAGLAVSIGYANQGIDDLHLHLRMTEVYLVARGSAQARVGNQLVHLEAGDVLIVEPNEVHTFLSSSPDYFHFVLHTPALPEHEAVTDRVAMDRATLPPLL